jgi:PhnB protein
MNFPTHHQTIMPYLVLQNVRGFLKFVQNVFDAQILEEHLDEDMRIMHAEVKIGESTLMMGEANEIWSVFNAGMFLYVPDADYTFALAKKEGAEVIQEISTKEYGRTAGIKDPFGNIWWITSL